MLIPALFLLLKWNPPAAWLLSLGLYVATHFFDWFTIPMAFAELGRFYFNPLSWQFLFFLGLVLGSKRLRGELRWLKSQVLACFSLLIILAAFYLDFVAPEFVSAKPEYEFQAMYQSLLAKQTMAPFRLIHFLAIAFIVNFSTSPQGRIWKSKIASPLVISGRNSLAVYCLGLVLMYLTVVLVSTLALGDHWILLFHLLGGGISICFALMIDSQRGFKSKQGTLANRKLV